MTRPRWRTLRLTALVLLVAGSAHAAPTPQPPERGPQVVIITQAHTCAEPSRKVPLDTLIQYDFTETTLGELTRIMRCLTEQHFLLGGVSHAAPVVVGARTPMTVYAAYKGFIRVLQDRGLVLVPNGRYVELVPEELARPHVMPSQSERDPIPRR